MKRPPPLGTFLPVATRGLAFTPYSDSEKYSLLRVFFLGSDVVEQDAVATHKAATAKNLALNPNLLPSKVKTTPHPAVWPVSTLAAMLDGIDLPPSV
ncbi:hypothetical protein [Agrobacterium sp.]|jgi:hypothetical protein|uniref:hypothetical protein n=1 Tax=Agrobacterium sp. TaxID=361 RepID=UPI003917EADF